jgi:hypothetical protein
MGVCLLSRACLQPYGDLRRGASLPVQETLGLPSRHGNMINYIVDMVNSIGSSMRVFLRSLSSGVSAECVEGLFLFHADIVTTR